MNFPHSIPSPILSKQTCPNRFATLLRFPECLLRFHKRGIASTFTLLPQQRNTNMFPCLKCSIQTHTNFFIYIKLSRGSSKNFKQPSKRDTFVIQDTKIYSSYCRLVHNRYKSLLLCYCTLNSYFPKN